MHRLPKIFSHSSDRRRSGDSDSVSGGSSSSSSSSRRAAKPRLDRRNARKDINYDYSPSSSASAPSSSSASSSYYTASEESVRTRSLDLYGGRKSFRVEGVDGEIEIMCKNLGFSGIDDFSISPDEYEVMKVRSISAPVGFSKAIVDVSDSDGAVEASVGLLNRGIGVSESLIRCSDRSGEVIRDKANDFRDKANVYGSAMVDSVRVSDGVTNDDLSGRSNEFRGSGGIKGVRPPFLGLLAPPPFMSLPVIDQDCSTWDIFRKFGPDTGGLQVLDEQCGSDRIEDGEDERRRRMAREDSFVLSAPCSFTASSNDGDSSSTTTDPVSSVSPNGRFRRVVSPWQKGDLLGRGSFGSVYEGIAE